MISCQNNQTSLRIIWVRKRRKYINNPRRYDFLGKLGNIVYFSSGCLHKAGLRSLANHIKRRYFNQVRLFGLGVVSHSLSAWVRIDLRVPGGRAALVAGCSIYVIPHNPLVSHGLDLNPQRREKLCYDRLGRSRRYGPGKVDRRMIMRIFPAPVKRLDIKRVVPEYRVLDNISKSIAPEY